MDFSLYSIMRINWKWKAGNWEYQRKWKSTGLSQRPSPISSFYSIFFEMIKFSCQWHFVYKFLDELKKYCTPETWCARSRERGWREMWSKVEDRRRGKEILKHPSMSHWIGNLFLRRWWETWTNRNLISDHRKLGMCINSEVI